MHYHPVPDDPSPPVTFCEAHWPPVDLGYVCDCARNVCVVCEEDSAESRITSP